MARAVTEAFQHMVLEIETEPGVFSRICGLTSHGVNRSHNMQTEAPDCDDESLPVAVERSVQSSEVTVSGSGS